MENEKAMDKQGMTAEREMEIMEAAVAEWGEKYCLERAETMAAVFATRALGVWMGWPTRGTTALKKAAAKMSVWLNVLSLVVGEPVEEEINYLEELAEEVGLDGE